MVEKKHTYRISISTPQGVFEIPNFSYRERWNTYKQEFDKLFTGTTTEKIFITCSGGSDSVCMTYLLVFYISIIQGSDLSNITLLYFSHETSSFDKNMIHVLEKQFPYLSFVYTRSSGKKTETALRKERYMFFQSSFTENLQNLQSVYLCLGHHLDDRIENTLLHIDRGSGLSGIVNMKKIQKKLIFIENTAYTYTIFRPLLDLTKSEIYALCKEFSLSFFEDPHNTDTKSKRIRLRKNIKKTLTPPTYDEIRMIYNEIDPLIKKDIYPYITISAFFGGEKKMFYRSIAPNSLEETRNLLSSRDLFGGVSDTHLKQLTVRFSKGVGYKKIKNRRVFLAHRFVYITPYTKKIFRTQSSPETITISTLGGYMLGGYARQVEEKPLIGGIMRFPTTGDIYKGKKLSKWCNTKKIPFFLRKNLPIIEKNHTIVAVLLPLERCR